MRLLKAIQTAQPVYSAKKWERDPKKSEELLLLPGHHQAPPREERGQRAQADPPGRRGRCCQWRALVSDQGQRRGLELCPEEGQAHWPGLLLGRDGHGWSHPERLRFQWGDPDLPRAGGEREEAQALVPGVRRRLLQDRGEAAHREGPPDA